MTIHSTTTGGTLLSFSLNTAVTNRYGTAIQFHVSYRMPAYAQLSFSPAAQAWTATVGIDSYCVVKNLPGPISSAPNSQYTALYIGNAAVRSLGASDKLETAMNLCQTDITSLST